MKIVCYFCECVVVDVNAGRTAPQRPSLDCDFLVRCVEVTD